MTFPRLVQGGKRTHGETAAVLRLEKARTRATDDEDTGGVVDQGQFEGLLEVNVQVLIPRASLEGRREHIEDERNLVR
jgi:hypothetical protein